MSIIPPYTQRSTTSACPWNRVTTGNTEHLALSGDRGAYFSEPSGIVALIFEAEADEHPPPPVPARVALLGSILRTDATALSICEDMVEKGRIARFNADRVMRGVDGLLLFCFLKQH
jgi:hypothetical protein